MDCWSTNGEHHGVGIRGSASLPGEQRLPWLVSRRDKPATTSLGCRLSMGVVLACFMAAFIGLFFQLKFHMPVSSAPAPVAPLSTTKPSAVLSDWKISSVDSPILGAPVTAIEVDTPRAMIMQLKKRGLWELGGEDASEIPQLVFVNFPNRLSEMSVGVRKKIFLHALLPVALVAMAEVEQERAELQVILGKFADQDIVFSEDQTAWQERLSAKEKKFIRTITAKYRASKASVLLDRIDVLPVSLVLAQGAFESFWGTSRFAREGNNLFGMWTWGERGIIPARRDPGKTHKLAIYGSILDAVRNFVLTINRLPAYKHLRQIRKKTKNSLTIADGLTYYSERGNAYIADVKTIIRVNDLTRFDGFALKDSTERTPDTTKLASL